MALRRKNAAKGQVENDLEALVSKGPDGAYEALQLFRSRALRFKTKGDNKAAITAAAHGARSLLKGGYTHAGSELSALLINLLDESGAELDTETRAIINDIDAAYEQNDKDSASVQRTDYLKSCIKWTQTCGSRELGDPQLHVRLGTSSNFDQAFNQLPPNLFQSIASRYTSLGHCLWGGEDGKRDIKQAIYHFVAGEAPVPINEKICATFGSNAAKRDQNLVIATMHFLAMENLRDANELLAQFKREQKTRAAVYSESALVLFLTQLLEVCRRDATPLFKTLVNQNLKILEFDEIVGVLLSGPIGQKFFGIQPKVNPMMQMMQQLLT